MDRPKKQTRESRDVLMHINTLFMINVAIQSSREMTVSSINGDGIFGYAKGKTLNQSSPLFEVQVDFRPNCVGKTMNSQHK